MRDAVVRAAHARLEQSEEPFDGLRMRDAVHVELGAVVHPVMARVPAREAPRTRRAYDLKLVGGPGTVVVR